MNKTNKTFSLQTMIEISLFAALGLVFDLIIPYRLPQGGSVSLAMLPIFVMAFRHGVKGGVATGAIIGTLQLLFGAYIFTPIQFVLDYTFAYGVVGMAGVMAGRLKAAAKAGDFRKIATTVVIGSFIGAFLRYAAHVVSGIVFFAEYAEGPVVLYSLTYNAAYMVPSFAVSALVLVALFKTAPRFTAIVLKGSVR